MSAKKDSLKDVLASLKKQHEIQCPGVNYPVRKVIPDTPIRVHCDFCKQEVLSLTRNINGLTLYYPNIHMITVDLLEPENADDEGEDS